MPFEFRPRPELPEVVLIVPKIFRDERGAVFPSFVAREFEAAGIPGPFVQDLVSRSTHRGVVRGLHFQDPPAAQGKLVRAIRGEVFDVAVDVRRGSPTFGRHTSARLSGENAHTLWIPPGFAHGFCTLADDVEMLYKQTHDYSPAHERIVRWDDPAIGIPWPVEKPVLAPKDAQAPLLEHAQIGFRHERGEQ